MAMYKFLSTRSAWSATEPPVAYHPQKRISIHALRMERDGSGHSGLCICGAFLSTRSAWSATPARHKAGRGY